MVIELETLVEHIKISQEEGYSATDLIIRESLRM
jgi:hypothetical protein